LNTSTVRAVAYYRMSSDKQEASIPAQRDAVQAYAAKNAFRIVREYRDEGISGDATEKRLGFQQMLKDASAVGDFKAVLCWDQDRFGRFDPLEAGYWVKPLRDAGIHLETVAQGRIDWNDFAGRIVYAVQQEGKHAFLRDLARNGTRGQLKAARKGKWMGGKPPYAYEARDGRLVPGEPEEVAVLRELFARYAGGASLRELARDLNRRGVPAPCGGAWWYNVIRKILRNPLYLGNIVWNRRHEGRYCAVVGGEITPETRFTRRLNPASEHVVRTGTHEALVDRRTFELVAARLEEARRHTSPRQADPFFLSGLVVCAQCGARMHGITQRKGGRVYRHYVCSAYQDRGKDACAHNRLPEAGLVGCVLRKVGEICRVPDNIPELRARVRHWLGGADAGARAEELRRQVAELDRKLAQGRERYLTAPPEIAEGLRGPLAAWEGQRARLAEELEDQEHRRQAALADVEARVDRAVGLLREMEEAAQGANPSRIQGVLRAAVAKVECWFAQQQRARYLRSFFTEGKIHLRPDVAILRLEIRALAWAP
jgi:DNA invertase Pin-like site-specific DNA recombinase